MTSVKRGLLKGCCMIASTLLIAGALVTQGGVASASTSPQANPSFYVGYINPSHAAALGCNQGHYDAAHLTSSVVILDFGGQNSAGTGTVLIGGTGGNVTYAQIETFAETFARNYYICTGGDTTTKLAMGIGTNNSISAYLNYSGGFTWSTVVNSVANYLAANGIGQVNTYGANDIEPSWNQFNPTYNWIQGWQSNTQHPYFDFGSADGCPLSGINGSCNNTWTQRELWLASWGYKWTLSTPEIYIDAQAKQWDAIALNGQTYVFTAPMDEYDLDHSTFTPNQAWTALQCGTNYVCNYATEIYWQQPTP